MTEGEHADLRALIAEMRANVQRPDDRDAGSIWSWRADEWADRLESVLASLIGGRPEASIVTDKPGHPVYAPCAIEHCKYDELQQQIALIGGRPNWQPEDKK